MLIDSRLKPELVAAKAPPAGKAGDPVTHRPREMVYILNYLPGVTPREVGEEETAGVAFATDGRAAVAVPVTLCRRYDHGDDEPPSIDSVGTVIPAALAHARKNLVAPKTASLELTAYETLTPDGAAFPRILPGADVVPVNPGSQPATEPDPAKPNPIKEAAEQATAIFGSLGITEAVDAITFCPFRLLAVAKAMGVQEGDEVTVLFRGITGPMTVIPRISSACYAGEAVGLLNPMLPNPKDETDSPREDA